MATKSTNVKSPKALKPTEFQLISQYLGYVTKPDPTNIGQGYLVAGSQNMVTSNGERVSARKGYSRLGAAASGTSYAIISSYEWTTNRGIEHALRRFNDTLQVLYVGTWYTLKTGLAISGVNEVNSNFAEFWDNTNKIDQLLFTDGSSNIFNWAGGVGVFASATVNTVTLSGGGTWAQAGFLTTGTRTIMINGVEATYSGGETTDTLTGVSVDFSATAVGSPVFQGVQTTAVSTFTSTNVSVPSTYLLDLISVLNNQVYIGSLNSREAYLSQANSFTNYSKSSPRVTGEGEKITLDGAIIGFAVGDSTNATSNAQVMNITAGRDFWYIVLFNPAQDNSNEAVQIRRLKTQPQKAARSQGALCNVINDILFVTQEPTFDSLGHIEQAGGSPTTAPLSDLIKPDFDTLDFTNCHVRYAKNNIYIAVPAESKVYIRNLAKNYWEPPQILPIRRLAVIGGILYGHSSQAQETYKLFDGTNDNGNPIHHIAAFSYNNGGVRDRQKSFDEHYTEGYLSPSTTITLTLNYDYQGFTQQLARDILGTNSEIIFGNADDQSLGTHPLGEVSLGGGGGDVVELPPKFRIINTFPREDYFEYQAIYSSDNIDQTWELLAFGPASKISEAQPISIKD